VRVSTGGSSGGDALLLLLLLGVDGDGLYVFLNKAALLNKLYRMG